MAEQRLSESQVRDFFLANGGILSPQQLLAHFQADQPEPQQKEKLKDDLRSIVTKIALLQKDDKGANYLCLKEKGAVCRGADGLQTSILQALESLQEDAGAALEAVETPGRQESIAPVKLSDEAMRQLYQRFSEQVARRQASSRKERDTDSESLVSGSLVGESERGWLLACSSCDLAAISKHLLRFPELVHFAHFLSGYTALHWASKFGCIPIIELLIKKYGSSIDKKTHGGYTPLHLAAIHGQEEVYELLLNKYGASECVRDNSGRKADWYLDGGKRERRQMGGKRRRSGSEGGAERLRHSWSSSGGFARMGSLRKAGEAAWSRFLGRRPSWSSADPLPAAPPLSLEPRKAHSASPVSDDRVLMPPPKAPSSRTRRLP